MAILNSATFGISEQLLRPLWFIPSLFVSDIAFVLIVYISNKFNKNSSKQLFIILAVLSIFTLGYFTHFPRHISSGLVGILLVYLRKCL